MCAKTKLPMEAYTERFVHTLNQAVDRNGDRDRMCLRIAANAEFARYSAVMLRRYVDPDFTEWLSADRKARMEARRASIVKAADGLEAAANLYRQSEPQTAAFLHGKAAELQAQLPRVDELLDTKRHGRFRDHGILDVARQEMEKFLGPMTWETLANLVNAAHVAHGQEDAPIETAQSLRQNLEKFGERNPYWNRIAI